MALTAITAALLIGQSAFSLGIDEPAPETADVAYEELSAGHSHAAVSKLESSEAAVQRDPAALINLGAAYARVGNVDKAIAAYRAAIRSPERYQLELADGSWVDSRHAAKLALKGLQQTSAQAAR